MKVKYIENNKNFKIELDGKFFYIIEEQVFLILGEFKKEEIDIAKINFLIKRTDTKMNEGDKEYLVNKLLDSNVRKNIVALLEQEIADIQKHRKNFPPKGLSNETILNEIDKLKKDFKELNEILTIDLINIDFKEIDYSIPENRIWLENNYIKAMDKAQELIQTDNYKNKINIFVFTRYSEEYKAEHTFFVMRIKDDYFEIEPAGEASRGYGKDKKDGTRVGLDEMRNLLMFKKVLQDNQNAKLFFKMTGMQADRVNCSVFTLDFVNSICNQLKALLDKQIANPEDFIAERLKKYFRFRFNEELEFNTGKHYEGDKIFHEGDIEVLKTYCSDTFKVLDENAKNRLKEIEESNLNQEEKNSLIKSIMNDENSYTPISNDCKIEMPDEFLPAELLVNCQIHSTILKSLNLSKKSQSEITLIDTIDKKEKTLDKILEQHKITQGIITKKLEEKTVKTSNRISKIRERILQ